MSVQILTQKQTVSPLLPQNNTPHFTVLV